MLRALEQGQRQRERESEKQYKPATSKSVTENGKVLFHFSTRLQSHTGNPLRPRKRNTLALLQKWACLWLLLISGFVSVAAGSSYGFAGDPQAFCVISRSVFCSLPEAICCREPFVLAFHARFGRRSWITGSTALTGTPLLVSPTTTSERSTQRQAMNPHISLSEQCVF